MPRARAGDFGAKQQTIRDRAAALFATRGFAATSTADVARACGISKALIWHYFESKEAILYDLLLAHVGALQAAADAALAESADPRAQFRAFLRAHLRLYAHARERHALLAGSLDVLAPKQRATIVAKQRKLVETAAKLLARLAPAMEAKPGLAWPAGMGLYGFINWTYTWYDPDGPMGPERFADFACEVFLGGIANAAQKA
ncbi:MAG: TetR/AcrR family transcriptional regulator [Tagaea sp.]|nr:TetR/AcrR family transcriptional regulator [Tagaea sp.]